MLLFIWFCYNTQYSSFRPKIRLFVRHFPRVKSGISTGELPRAIESSDNGEIALQDKPHRKRRSEERFCVLLLPQILSIQNNRCRHGPRFRLPWHICPERVVVFIEIRLVGFSDMLFGRYPFEVNTVAVVHPDALRSLRAECQRVGAWRS